MKGMSAMTLALCASVSSMASAQHMTANEQWACEIAMCLSHPAGPTAVAECEAPIRTMHRQLAKGATIPKCTFLSAGPSTGTGGGRGDRDRSDRAPPQAH